MKFGVFYCHFLERGEIAIAKGKYEQWLTEEGLLLLESWARDGLTDEQMAQNMGITAKTLYEWKKKYSKICEALKKGKEVVDIQVENALFKRAIGYEYEEKTIETGDFGEKTKTVIKQMPPDTTAIIFWLKNRKPTKWRDKVKEQTEESTESKLDKLIGLTEEVMKDEHK